MRKIMILSIILVSFLSTLAQAGCTFPTAMSRVWDNVENDLLVDISILSKICTIGSTLNYLETSLNQLSSSFNADIATITSYVADIDQRVITIGSTTNDINSLITGPINSKLIIIEKDNSSIQSLVNVIDTRTSSIYSLDQNISSIIDQEIATDQTIFSKVMVIDSKLSNLNLSCSGTDQILQTDQSILSTVNVIDTRTNSIYSLDQTISSYAQEIDQHVVTIQSAVNTINTFISSTINSELDVINSTNYSIQSVVNVIDTRTSSIYSLDQAISSKIDNYTTLSTSVQSAVNVVNSKIDNLKCIASLTGQLPNLDQSILSTVMVIDTRTATIQSSVGNIFSLDQIISSDISNILNIQQTSSSKIDVNIAIDQTTQSILNYINSNLSNPFFPCSQVPQLLAIDQSILSTVNVIDTRTTNIQSNINNISRLDQSISSKIDLDLAIDTRTQSVVNIINSKINLTQTNIASISNFTNATQSIIAGLSTCCTGTTNANTVLTSLYNTVVADQSNDNISISFQYGIPTSIITTYTQGGGSVTNANSMALLSTAAATNSIAQLQTKASIVYRSGHEAYAYFSVAFTGSFAATSSQFIGPIDYQNGFAVGFDGTTFGITWRANAVSNFTPQSQFNGDTLNGSGPSQFTYNPSALNIFRIAYGYLGASIIKFQILTSYNNWITFHTIYYPNTSTTPSILQPFLPITARVENLTGTSVLTLQTSSWNAGIVAEPSNNSYRYFQTNTTINTASFPAHLFTIRNSTTFNNYPNQIAVRLTGLGGCSDGGAADYFIIKNATISGTSYSDVNSGNSVVAVTTAGTYAAGTGTLVWDYSTFNAGNGFGPFYFTNNPYLVMIYPGETLTLLLNAGASSTNFVGVLFWEEQF